MMSKTSMILLVSMVTALPAAAWDCDHKADRSLSEDLNGVSRVELLVAAGDLDIEGDQGVSSLEAEGEACASDTDILEGIQIVAKRRGATLRIEAQMPKTSGWGKSAALGLRVVLPADLPVEVKDSSGDLAATGAYIVRLDDGSGDIRLKNTQGDLELSDGSGDVKITDHRGNLNLEDGSGDVRIVGVEGSVLVDADGSGDLNIKQIQGSVTVDEDGSGDISVAEVSGDFTVDRAGSGDVYHRDVSGKVDVPTRD